MLESRQYSNKDELLVIGMCLIEWSVVGKCVYAYLDCSSTRKTGVSCKCPYGLVLCRSAVSKYTFFFYFVHQIPRNKEAVFKMDCKFATTYKSDVCTHSTLYEICKNPGHVVMWTSLVLSIFWSV